MYTVDQKVGYAKQFLLKQNKAGKEKEEFANPGEQSNFKIISKPGEIGYLLLTNCNGKLLLLSTVSDYLQISLLKFH